MLPGLRNKNFLDDFFYNSYVPDYSKNSNYYNTPAVNIVEEKANFKIEVIRSEEPKKTPTKTPKKT